jgi:hypothetical protein
MEHLFSTCTRLFDMLVNHDAVVEDDDPEEFFDSFMLADGLRRNSRLKSVRVYAYKRGDAANQELLAISDALKENKSLVQLQLWYDFGKSDEAWGAICDSLETHPTLEVLELRNLYYSSFHPSVYTSRLQALVHMLKVNTLIHTIHLDERYSEHEIYRGSVIPYLERNRLRSRLLAIQKTRQMTYRAKLLGRALLAVRTDPNSFWMLLSGNPEVTFCRLPRRSEQATADFPTCHCYRCCCRRHFYYPWSCCRHS